jgi:hypothetical protein
MTVPGLTDAASLHSAAAEVVGQDGLVSDMESDTTADTLSKTAQQASMCSLHGA